MGQRLRRLIARFAVLVVIGSALLGLLGGVLAMAVADPAKRAERKAADALASIPQTTHEPPYCTGGEPILLAFGHDEACYSVEAYRDTDASVLTQAIVLDHAQKLGWHVRQMPGGKFLLTKDDLRSTFTIADPTTSGPVTRAANGSVYFIVTQTPGAQRAYRPVWYGIPALTFLLAGVLVVLAARAGLTDTAPKTD